MSWGISHLPIILLAKLLGLYNILIMIRVLLSWIIQDPYNKYYRILIAITEPVLGPIRRILPQMSVDFSPVVAWVIIQIITSLLYRLV